MVVLNSLQLHLLALFICLVAVDSAAQFRSQPNRNRNSQSGSRRQSNTPSQTRRASSDRISGPDRRSCDSDGVAFLAGDSCDSYFRCLNGTAVAQQCPDGLLFAPNRSYPCAYPQEQTCQLPNRAPIGDFLAPGTPGECSRDFQIFRSPTSDIDCATYTSCVNGEGYIFSCSETQAFNDETLVCDYADQVSSCDVEAYLNYKCEQREFTEQEIGQFTFEPHSDDCRKFYTCINHADGRVLPRPGGCPEFTVFNRQTLQCTDTPEDVPGCENVYPAQLLKDIREQRQKIRESREKRLLDIAEKLRG